jgi:ubiquinone/menaquinone biosynthesis C-methylase UbiE
MDADEYLKLAEVEDRMWYFRSLHAHVARELVGAGLRINPDVLDAGCGTGGLLLRARNSWPAARWQGIDFMPLACELARRRCGAGVDIREASVTALPFADASFDAVVSVDVICQVENPTSAMAEFFRVLRPGGLLIVSAPAYQWLWSYHDETVQTKHRYTRAEIRALLHEAGFLLGRVTHLNALPFPLVWAKRKLFHTASDTSDVKDFPAAIDAMFRAMMAVEHAWLREGANWAWGSSVFAVARKPQGSPRSVSIAADRTARDTEHSAAPIR